MLLPHIHLMFYSRLPCVHYVHSRPMMSHHVTCHITTMSHASLSLIKEKEIQKKRNIKSRKIDKRKKNISVQSIP